MLRDSTCEFCAIPLLFVYLRIHGCVFSSIPLLFVYLRMRMSSNPRSIAGAPFDSVGILRTTFVLRTTCMRSCCNWSASCVAA